MKTEIRVVVADDHPIFRDGLVQVIEKDPHIKVIAAAPDGEMAFDSIRKWRPDVAVLDIDMPGKDGFEVVRRLREAGLPVPTIFLTMYKDEMHLNEALDLGVKGYVLKDSAATEVVNGIKAVAEGKTYISAALSSYLLDRGQRAAGFNKTQPRIKDLTAAERTVLILLAEHKTSKEIAVALGISARTVENHRANICAKLDLRGTHALVKFAVQHRSELSFT